MGQWSNLEAFQAWVKHIENLAADDPTSPIPKSVVLLTPNQTKLTNKQMQWANQMIYVISDR